MAKQKIDIFGSAKTTDRGKRVSDNKEIVYVSGLEDKLLEFDFLKAQISDLESQLAATTDIIKNIGKDKFIELYEENKTNPNTFYIKDGKGCVMVIPMDRYITIKDEERINDLTDKYGDDVVAIDEKFYFNNDVLERNMVEIQNIIANSKKISDEDKRNLLVKEIKYSIKKGMIDKLSNFTDIEAIVDDIQPVISLKNCGGKMAEGGEMADNVIGFIYE
jgi:hypothetical protein